MEKDLYAVGILMKLLGEHEEMLPPRLLVCAAESEEEILDYIEESIHDAFDPSEYHLIVATAFLIKDEVMALGAEDIYAVVLAVTDPDQTDKDWSEDPPCVISYITKADSEMHAEKLTVHQARMHFPPFTAHVATVKKISDDVLQEVCAPVLC